MKLELERQDFLKAWQIAERIAQTKTAKDSTNGILITATDTDITLQATDLKTSVKCKAVGANVIEPGSAVVPATILGSMLKKAASEDLVLEVSSSRGILRAGGNKTRFAVLPAEEFPSIPASSDASLVCELKAAVLAQAIIEGGVAASQPLDFPRYIGTCFFKTCEGCLKIASTDGKRLSVSKVVCDSMAKEQEFLLNAPASKDFAKTLSASYSDNNVKILADESTTAWFQLDDVEFSMRRVEANFPPYERILNSEVYTSLKIKSSDLLPVLDRIDIIARETAAHIMALNLNPENSTVKVTARAPEKGTASETLQAVITGSNLDIGFNMSYFQDGLKVLGQCVATIEFSSEDGQTRMKRNDNEESFMYMLMPARLTLQDRLTDEEIEEIEI